LQGVQTKGGDGGGVGVIVDAEHAALFAQAVCIEIETFNFGSGVCAVR
ncbi:MAG: hypothetical protein JOZ84_13355, partial [Methylobacteriaceae bacterium]|nr:hypothetical protein [Methylobacteriaceae bacterium]